MKKLKKLLGMMTMTMLLCILAIPAKAATVNPLSEMRNFKTIVVCGRADKDPAEFVTPEYKEDFVMTVKSSNTKVATATVKTEKRYVNNDDKNKRYFKKIHLTQKGYGTTKLTVTAKVEGKTYKKTVTVTFYKYSSPFKSFKINGKEYASKFKSPKSYVPKLRADNDYDGSGIKYSKYLYVNTGSVTGKISYKLNPGYKITYISGEKSNGDYKRLKNGSKLSKGDKITRIEYEDTKKKIEANIQVNQQIWK